MSDRASLWTRMKRVFGWESRISPSNPSYWLLRALRGVPAFSGIQVDAENAMESTPFLAGSSRIAETIAGLPLKVFRKDGDRREAVPDHPLVSLLHDAPNDWMTSFTWRETSMHHLLAESNCYSQVLKNGGGEVTAIIPLSPSQVRGELRYVGDDPVLSYRVMTKKGEKLFPPERMVHVRALSWDGITGRSRVYLTREALGISLAEQRYAGGFFGNGARPDIVITNPSLLNEDAVKRMAESWEAAYGGLENAHKPAILEQGSDVKELSKDPQKTQMVEARKFQVTEIARSLGLPPHMVGDLERATFANIEEQSLEYVTYTVLPWVLRWEQELNMKLLSRKERAGGLFVGFVLEGLLRGDLLSRFKAYLLARQGGWMTQNEIRTKENLNPIEGGDSISVPLNSNIGVDPNAGMAEEQGNEEK